MLKGYLENSECTVSPPVTSSATLRSTRAVPSTRASTTTRAMSTTNIASSLPIASSSAGISSTHVASSISVSSSSSSTAFVTSIPTFSVETSPSPSASGSSMSAVFSGSSNLTASGEVVVSVTAVSTVSRCPPNVSHCPFQPQTTASIASLASIPVPPSENGSSSSPTIAITSSVPAPTEKGTTATSFSVFESASGSMPSPSGALGSGTLSNGPSVVTSWTPPSGSPSSIFYRNATSSIGSSAPAAVTTSPMPPPILSGTTVSPVPASTDYTSLTTYTTVTTCPVTTTKVQSGTTSIIVETTVITSTITTCPLCSEKTKSVSGPGYLSSTPGSPIEVGTTVPASNPSVVASPSPSSVPQSGPSVVPGAQSTGPLPNPTTYTTTKIVSTLTTTCSEATTFSLSSSGRVYTATVVCLTSSPSQTSTDCV